MLASTTLGADFFFFGSSHRQNEMRQQAAFGLVVLDELDGGIHGATIRLRQNCSPYSGK